MHGTHKAKRGQAMIEIIIAMIAIMALFVGLLQIASLTRAQTDTMIAARRNAAEQAMSTSASIGTPDYIEETLVGNDGSTYSVDDEFTTGSIADFTGGLVDLSAADSAAWGILDGVAGNRISTLRNSSVPTFDLLMVSGDDDATVPLISAVQKLIYDAESIDVESKVWMPWMSGIY